MNEQRTALAESHPSHDFYAGLVCMGVLEIVLALTALLAAMKMQRTGGQTMLAPSQHGRAGQFHLSAAAAARATAERVHGFHADHCPIYRSLRKAIAITTELKIEEVG